MATHHGKLLCAMFLKYSFALTKILANEGSNVVRYEGFGTQGQILEHSVALLEIAYCRGRSLAC